MLSRLWAIERRNACQLVDNMPEPESWEMLRQLRRRPIFFTATNAFESALASLIFENANGPANLGDATGLRGSSTAGVFYISLHEANPNETGDQTTSEGNYTSYARVSVARSTAGWSVASGVADNDAAITFPACTGGSDTESHFGVGSDSSGAGNLFIWGALTATLAVSSGITPSFAAGTLDVSVD